MWVFTSLWFYEIFWAYMRSLKRKKHLKAADQITSFLVLKSQDYASGHGSENMQETPPSKCRKRVLEKHLSSLGKGESCVPNISALVIVTREFRDNTFNSHILQDTELWSSWLVKAQICADTISLTVTQKLLCKCRWRSAYRLLDCCLMNNLGDAFTLKTILQDWFILNRTYSTCLYSWSVRSWIPVTTIHKSLYTSLKKKKKR